MASENERVICRHCRSCNLPAYFVDSVRGRNGTRIPLDDDLKTWHRCVLPTRQEIGSYFNEERLALDAVDYVSRINNRLQSFYLGLERVSK